MQPVIPNALRCESVFFSRPWLYPAVRQTVCPVVLAAPAFLQRQEFISDSAPDRELQLPISTLHVKAAYEAFRQICLAGGGGGGGGGGFGGGGGGGDASGALAEAQEVIRKMKVQIKQRNHEIEILVNMLDKKEGCGRESGGCGPAELFSPSRSPRHLHPRGVVAIVSPSFTRGLFLSLADRERS